MAQVLDQIATMQENAMLDEFDNLLSIAREELSENRDVFETNVSTLDVLVRRADSLVISLLSDSYSHYGQIENYRVFHGSNYDTQSGRELLLMFTREVKSMQFFSKLKMNLNVFTLVIGANLKICRSIGKTIIV